MPTDAADIYGTVFKNGTASFLARVVGADGQAIGPADITAVQYSIYLLDDESPDDWTPMAGHTAVPLAADGVLSATLELDAAWTRDTLGFNFRHTPDVSVQPAFPQAGRRFLVEYRLWPVVGQVVVIRFRTYVI